MSINLNSFSKIKNNFCVAYYGPCNEYIIQLLFLKKSIQNKFPDINFNIACRDSIFNLINDDCLISKSKVNKNYFIANKNFIEIKSNMVDHPIEEFIKNSKLDIPKIEYINTNYMKCVIYPDCIAPNKKLNTEELNKIIKFCSNSGYEVEVNGNYEDAGWVVGTENFQLFSAVFTGIKTTLIDSGLGANLFKILNSNNKILKISELYNFKD